MSDSLFVAGTEARYAGGFLTVDLDALRQNYSALAKVCAPARTAGVVKADAYGLGVAQVGPALASAGCNTFFVALPHEGIALRAAVPEAQIFVLNGLFGADTAPGYAEYELIPVLNSLAEVHIWETFCGTSGTRHPCAIHVDTGMNRLGLTPAEARTFADDNELTRALRVVLVMSHLACGDDPAHPANLRQLESFQQVAAVFPDIESSICNSAGIMLGAAFHMNLTRPGIALYGGAPLSGVANPMRPVVTAQARIVQIRRVATGEAVSYGGTVTLGRDALVAVAAVGYADGYHRASSGSGVPLRGSGGSAGHGFIAGRRVPILGRVTMDLTMFDITDCGDGIVNRGDLIELFGPNISIDEAATAAGTISYELLTSLGKRYHRRYVGIVEGS